MARLTVKEIRASSSDELLPEQSRSRRRTCEQLLSRTERGARLDGGAPDLPGVGRKTANLVLILRTGVPTTSVLIRTSTAVRIAWGG